jgi:Bacterial regulatory helix-turn-helix protein, lysR family
MAILPSLQQLRFLRALAEQCHFGRAAESCVVTQSTLSGGIKALPDKPFRTREHLRLTRTLKHHQRAKPRITLPSIHRLFRLRPSKFPVSYSEPGDHISPGGEKFDDH